MTVDFQSKASIELRVQLAQEHARVMWPDARVTLHKEGEAVSVTEHGTERIFIRSPRCLDVLEAAIREMRGAR